MKVPKHLQFPLFLLSLALAYFLFALAIMGAKPKAVSGVCIHEVVVNQLTNQVIVGWTPPPCEILDVRIREEHERVFHSPFTPRCAIFAVRSLPEIPIPNVDYEDGCALDLLREPQIDEGVRLH